MVAASWRDAAGRELTPAAWVVVVATVVGAALACRSGHRRILAAALLFVLPPEKDGPLDLDLWTVKLAMVCLILLVAPRQTRISNASCYRRFVPLMWIPVFLALASFALSAHPSRGIESLQVLATSTLLVVLYCEEASPSLIRHGIRAVVAITIVIVVVAFLQFATITWQLDHAMLQTVLPPEFRTHYFQHGWAVDERGLRLPSLFFHSNQLGHFLGMSFGFLFALALHARRFAHRWLIGGTLLLIVACCFLTQSRVAAVMIVVQALVLLALLGGTRVRLRHVVAMTTVVALFALLFRDNVVALLRRLMDLGLTTREAIWECALRIAAEAPVFGVGPGNGSCYIVRRCPELGTESMVSSYYAQAPYQEGIHAHSFYLHTALETGIPSLLVQIVLYGMVIITGLRLSRRGANRTIRVLAAAAVVPLACEFPRGLVESHCFLGATETGAMSAFFVFIVLYVQALDQRRLSVPVPDQ